jgi:hypothetical protein
MQLRERRDVRYDTRAYGYAGFDTGRYRRDFRKRALAHRALEADSPRLPKASNLSER